MGKGENGGGRGGRRGGVEGKEGKGRRGGRGGGRKGRGGGGNNYYKTNTQLPGSHQHWVKESVWEVGLTLIQKEVTSDKRSTSFLGGTGEAHGCTAHFHLPTHVGDNYYRCGFWFCTKAPSWGCYWHIWSLYLEEQAKVKVCTPVKAIKSLVLTLNSCPF